MFIRYKLSEFRKTYSNKNNSASATMRRYSIQTIEVLITPAQFEILCFLSLSGSESDRFPVQAVQNPGELVFQIH